MAQSSPKVLDIILIHVFPHSGKEILSKESKQKITAGYKRTLACHSKATPSSTSPQGALSSLCLYILYTYVCVEMYTKYIKYAHECECTQKVNNLLKFATGHTHESKSHCMQVKYWYTFQEHEVYTIQKTPIHSKNAPERFYTICT